MDKTRIEQRVQLLMADAYGAHEAGDRGEAHALATAVLALDPNNVEAEALLDGSDQRCQMTLMFCDLVGSTALADRIDPEEMSAILRDYRSTCTEVIERLGGFIEDRQGDGLLVRFGYPWVHEDDARRAVLSGLEIVRALARRRRDLHMRIAVHTGLVVLDGGEVVGAAPNEAARLQALAEPDTVVISDATYALVHNHFDVRSRGKTSLRGVSRPVESFTVLGERTNAALAAATSSTPFIDRRGERELVAELWQASCRGEPDGPAALLITAPAGMGKSRLVCECALANGAPLLACQSSSYHKTTSLHPFKRLLENICGITADDGPDQRLAKLRPRLPFDGGGHDLPALTAALSIPADAMAPPTNVDPSKLRILALHAAAHLVRSAAQDGPALLFVDDLQWADQSSLDLIAILLAEPCPRLLLVLATRPGFSPPWPDGILRRLHLRPLDAPDLEEMARGMTDAAGLAEDRQRQLIMRSDGVPLFLEELVRTGSALGGDTDPGGTLQGRDVGVPAALRDPLLARLVIPGVDLALAQIASTIGREVDRDLLQEASGLSDRKFQAKLANLVAAGLVDPTGPTTIRFRHELIREVAYETQRWSARRERHSRIADLLREGSSRRQADAGALAFHLEQAQRTEEAIAAHMEATHVHQSLGAHQEAISTLTHVLELIEQLPAGPSRLVSELTARQLRSFSTVMTGGYSAPGTARDHARCVELCEHLGLVPELLPSLIASEAYYCFRGDLADADRVCTTMERVVDDRGLPSPGTTAMKSVVIFFRGRLHDAHALMEAFVEDPWGHTADAPPNGWPLPNDPLAAILAHLVLITWMRDDRAASREWGERALRRAAQLHFPYGPFSAGYVKSQLAIVRRLEGDHVAAAQVAEEMIELGDRHGFVLWTLAGLIQRLLSQVHLGDATKLGPLVAAVGQWRELQGGVFTPYWLTELAAAQIAAGRHDDARASLDEALAVAALNGSEHYSAETLRVRGLLRCERGDPGGVDDLAAAVSKAREQGAGALERRAAEALDLERARSLTAP